MIVKTAATALRKHLAIGVIILISLALRFPILSYGIPQAIHPDDAYVLAPAITLASDPLANPHKFGLPDSTLFYTQAFGLGAGFFVARALGISHAPTLDDAYEHQEAWIYVAARSWNLLYVAGIIILVYAIGIALFKQTRVGLLAALIVACSSMLIEHTAYIRPDIPLAFWSLVVLWCSIRIYERGESKHYVFAAIASGLAIATKYPGVLTFMPIIGAHLLRVRKNSPSKHMSWHRALFAPDLIASLGVMTLTFFIATPHALHSPVQLIKDIVYEGRSRHPGADGFTPLKNLFFYLRTTLDWGIGTFASIVAACSFFLLIVKYKRAALLVSLFPLSLITSLSFHPLHWNRWMIPILPFVALLAAYGIDTLLRKWLQIGVVATALVLLPVMTRGISMASSFTHPESRELATQWIEQHIPLEAVVLRDSYAPQVDGTKWKVGTVDTIAEKSVKEYKKQGVEYLIESSDQQDKITSGSTSNFLEIHQRDVIKYTSKVICIPESRDELIVHATEISDLSLFGTTRTRTHIRGAQICIYRIP